MKYSIITPVFNREDCIERCIKSVIKQLNYSISLEHIIVDDGSSDNTSSIIQLYAERFNHIKFIKFAKNRGTNAARNAAVKAAKGDFCIILDSDDYFVDDAIKIIENEVGNGEYREYMFSPNDMVRSYSLNPLLNHSMQVVIKYEDFLAGNVSGDFVHVIDSNIMKRHPFDENMRIYEFIYFLQFYKEAQSILFTNKIVTIRERSRSDSVSREMIRTKKVFIERNLQAIITLINNFGSEFIKYGLTDKLQYYLIKKIDNALLLSAYNTITNDINHIQGRKAIIYKLIYKLKIGWLYRIALKTYLIIKYNILRLSIK